MRQSSQCVAQRRDGAPDDHEVEIGGPSKPTVGRVTFLVRAPDNREAERRYVFGVVLGDWLGFDYELTLEHRDDVSIRLVGDPEPGELRLADVFLAIPDELWLSSGSIPTGPLARIDVEAAGLPDARAAGVPTQAAPLPILFGSVDADSSWLTHAPHEVILKVDVFGSVFFMITRYEEVAIPERDAHERFPASASLASANGFLSRPIADEYVDLLWRAIHWLWPALKRRPTEFRLRLTHDVDRPWATLGRLGKVAHSLAGDLVVRRDPGLAARRLRAAIDARSGRVDRDPWNTFAMLMDTSERYGLRSTFYFMAGASDPRFDGSYRISDPQVMRLIRQIHDRGHDIGLHSSYETFNSLERMQTEFERLKATCQTVGIESDVWGVRQHYLRFEAPLTWRNQQAAGLTYDSSLGFADVNGFRTGTCREFPAFDVVASVPLTLRERP